MQRTNIYLQHRQTAALDEIAAAEGISRAELIRRIIDERLGGRRDDLTVDLVWIEESFGVAVDIDLPERSAGAREEHLERIGRRQ